MSWDKQKSTRRRVRRYRARRAKAVAKGCVCLYPLDYNSDDAYIVSVARFHAERCPFHKGKN